MKSIAVFASLLLAISIAPGARATEPEFAAQQPAVNTNAGGKRLAIRIASGDWGDAEADEIEAVLQAVGTEVMRHFPGRRLDPILVSPSRSGAPIVLYQRGRQDEYQVQLAAKGRRWAEYVYEFSHELFHIVLNYQLHAPPHSARHQWFEESLCETMSLYTLKRLSATWAAAPPRAEWASYASSLDWYTQRVLNEPHRRLPQNTSLAQWLRQNDTELAVRPYLRAKNELVANLLLPLLEQEADWQAFDYFNLDVPQGASSFHDFLAAWFLKTPPEHRAMAAGAMGIFQFELPDAEAEKLAAHPPPLLPAQARRDAQQAGVAGARLQ